MTGSAFLQKSLVEQILDEMFATLGAQPDFEADTIADLKRLAAEGDLKKDAKVISALRPATETLEEAVER